MRRPKTNQITHAPPEEWQWEEYCDWLEAQVEALREAASEVVDSEYCFDGYMGSAVNPTYLDNLRKVLMEQEDGPDES